MRPGDLVIARNGLYLYRFEGFRSQIGEVAPGETFLVAPNEKYPRIFTSEVRVLHPIHGVVFAPTSHLDVLQRSDSTP